MKVLVAGDQHFKLDLPYGTSFPDGRRAEWDSVKAAIHSYAEECEEIVLMGDNLDKRHNNSKVIDEFITFLKGFGEKPVHILLGNHERFGLSTALDFLKNVEFPTWNVYTNITVGSIGGRAITFVPYLTPAMVGAIDHEEGVKKAMKLLPGGDVAFCHQGITGAKTHGTMVDLFNEIVLPKEALEKKYGRILTGHIHTQQKLSEKTHLTGSIFTAEVGEPNKSVWILDTEDLSLKECPLPVRGIYGVENPTMKEKIPKVSIVKCTITDKKINVEAVKEWLSTFDAHLLIEKYSKERKKVHFEEGSALDLSVDNLLTVYSEVRKVDLPSLKAGFDLIRGV
jgi:DNA repair exonuclease SbcCD nuclease subunit